MTGPRLPLACAALAALAACAAPSAAPDPFAASGELIAFGGGEAGARAACATCHGLRGEGDGELVPRLAGLDAGYAARQLDHFVSGARRHPQMAWIARTLGPDARQKVSAYYAALPVPVAPAGSGALSCAGAELYHRGDPARGLAACAACHGADGAGNAGNPPLARQPAPYLAHQLDAWATGERYGDPDGAMTHVSRLLSRAERAAVAGYAARLTDAPSGRQVRAACLRTRRPDRPGGA